MDRRHLLSALAGVGGAALSGCVSAPATGSASTPAGTPRMGAPDDVDAPTDRLVAGNADFGFALLDRLAADAPDRNRFVSPYSIGVALAMTYAGARGDTRTEMAETLRFRPTGDDLHATVASLRASLPLEGHGSRDEQTAAANRPSAGETTTAGREEGDPFRLAGANAVWGQDGYPFRDAYLRTLDEYYGASLGRVDFEASPERAREAINGWVSDRTDARIPHLFPKGSIDRMTRLVLANAVYFRANWAETFDERDTESRAFTALDGTTGEVPTMHQQAEFPFAEVGGAKVLELPYAGDGTDMTLLLPPRGRFREFERSLDADRFADLLDATDSTEVEVALPRFAFRSNLGLAKRLAAMGMPTAFSRNADFSGMADGNAGDRLRLGAVRHDAYVRVDEQGTEAAAATGVEVVYTGAVMNPAEFVADRPFLFVIRHRSTGTPLFVGRVADAAAAQPRDDAG